MTQEEAKSLWIDAAMAICMARDSQGLKIVLVSDPRSEAEIHRAISRIWGTLHTPGPTYLMWRNGEFIPNHEGKELAAHHLALLANLLSALLRCRRLGVDL